ncbi:hypothetical protein EMCRGX_G033288 [Ephydatia muelleri]
MSKKLSLLAAVLVLCTPPLTKAQQPRCSSSFTNTSVQKLIAQNYQRQDGSRPTITLQPSPAGFTFHVVCLSSSGMRNMYRFVSIVAYFTTDDETVSSAGVPIYGQFEFECDGSAWSAMSSLLDHPSTVRTVPTAAINAAIRTDCAYCLKPADPMGPPRNTDPFNHCSNCSSGCTQPLCYTRDSAIPDKGYYSSVCCNYYDSNGGCMDACPSSSFPDANRTCVQCTLSCQNGGVLRNDICACNCSSSLVYGGTECTACQCQNGGTCSGSVCTCPPGYTGSMCENACPTSCPASYYLTNCSCVLICPCNGASIQCGTYATTNAGSNNVTITGTYLKCSIASNNVTSFRQHAIVATSLQAISVSSADYYQCILNWQLLQHSASVALSSLGYKGLGLSYTTGHGSVESINLDVDNLSRIVSSNDYTIGGSLDSSVACPFYQLVQWLSTAASEVPSATCRDSNTGSTVATFSVNCL